VVYALAREGAAEVAARCATEGWAVLERIVEGEPELPLGERTGFFRAVILAQEGRAGRCVVQSPAVLGGAVGVAFGRAIGGMYGIVLTLLDERGYDRARVEELLAFEREIRSFRIRIGRDRAPLQKAKKGAPLPYGFWRQEDGSVGRDEREQLNQATARDLRATGLSLRAIAAELTRQGMLPRDAAAWSAQTISAILSGQSGKPV
jgi:hypothetical protein